MVFLKWILGYNKPPKYCDADVEFAIWTLERISHNAHNNLDRQQEKLYDIEPMANAALKKLGGKSATHKNGFETTFLIEKKLVTKKGYVVMGFVHPAFKYSVLAHDSNGVAVAELAPKDASEPSMKVAVEECEELMLRIIRKFGFNE